MRHYSLCMRLTEEHPDWNLVFNQPSDTMARIYAHKIVSSTKIVGAHFWLYSPEMCIARYHTSGVDVERFSYGTAEEAGAN